MARTITLLRMELITSGPAVAGGRKLALDSGRESVRPGHRQRQRGEEGHHHRYGHLSVVTP